MDASALLDALRLEVPEAAVELAPSGDAQMALFISSAHVRQVAQLLRDRPEWRFSLLVELTAVDYWPREPRFEVIYLLVSIEHRARLRLKARVPGEHPSLSTVTGVWPAAGWLEREVWDLFGIVFDGHPDPRRLLMPEDWEGYPLRKDYPVQINVPVRTSEPTQVSEAEFRANLERDRLVRRGERQ